MFFSTWFSCVSHHQQSPGDNNRGCERASVWLFVPLGGMSLPALGCLRETQAGSIASLAGPWECVTIWCQFRGSFTLKNGHVALAASTTGVIHTTGANTEKKKLWLWKGLFLILWIITLFNNVWQYYMYMSLLQLLIEVILYLRQSIKWKMYWCLVHHFIHISAGQIWYLWTPRTFNTI